MGLYHDLLREFELAFATEPNQRATHRGLGSCSPGRKRVPIASSATHSAFQQHAKGLRSHRRAAVCTPDFPIEDFS